MKMILMTTHQRMKNPRKSQLLERKLHQVLTLNKDLERQVKSNRKLHLIVMMMRVVVRRRNPLLKVAESNLMSPLETKKLLVNKHKMMMKK